MWKQLGITNSPAGATDQRGEWRAEGGGGGGVQLGDSSPNNL